MQTEIDRQERRIRKDLDETGETLVVLDDYDQWWAWWCIVKDYDVTRIAGNSGEARIWATRKQDK